MNYHRLSEGEREEISRMLAQGCSFGDIARFLGRSVSTVSNEVSAGGCNRYVYRAATAHRRAQRKARKRKLWKRKILLEPRMRRYVQAKLRLRWSPEEIARKIAKEYPLDMTMRISPEAIYSYLYVLPRGALKKELLACLRRERKRRHTRRSHAQEAVGRGQILDMLSIEERPAEVADRIIPGHWEGDLLIGKNRQSALGSLVERTTRTTILVPLKDRTAETVRKAFAKEAKKIPLHMRLSLTYDQGKEMAGHKLFTKDTRMQVYFAHPASPWERGTNENTNGLIRQFFPKGTDFSKISRREVKHVQHLLNGRPRKVLDYATPYEIFNVLLR
ncbi:transposase [Candidatus Uhrbacteria bacterium RIFCSPLOWO2_01_FULL_47_24]|uniref:Transposase n=1 Tax=Candidatus Uhrbacteria bacterium RIFCSPLOWO2_01_FULL_47_24 TaxID=1802401 RepID=A0A1F7USX9_9BACT|nr:MAG: transposase [Candidatus Uhrbacteria bacterium RIFCSPHIGHO2_02_FULL_46_47]OGL81366.1 MAG: transposase [Candidatus Uhrbacteria bacterium RIFCSPLOWO2_01_FULL_47_24]OGL83800.1 MAG: transposase [Candidatus Uhrbacteria bacterium RIFCSPLOWO2_02_FULL_46_25]OGL91652.1 MAG: transposase [Candidatus Uhrbacteria bacterium RIFCSPLOWO2_12_FULL_47_10]